jgi:hypothetical protein
MLYAHTLPCGTATQIDKEKGMPVDSQYYQAEQAGADAWPEPVGDDPPDGEAEAIGRALQRMRNKQGQWQKGVSGNPAGRPLGSRNRATLMAQALLDASSALIISKNIERAVRGDGVDQRFLLARVLPPRRSAPVELDLPPLDTQKDLALAIAAVGRAVAAGEVTPAEAAELTRLFEAGMRAIEKREHEYSARHPYGQRPPAAPPLPAQVPAEEPDETACPDLNST